MRARCRVACLLVAGLMTSAGSMFAQTPAPMRPGDPGVIPDDELTLVVGTRFVTAADGEATAKAQFMTARIPLSQFNETDHCVDQVALDLAKEYFTTLGRMMGKAGQFYFLPEDQIKRSVESCEKQHGAPPQAWIESKTKVSSACP